MAATVHDPGKMYVPSEILSKPGRLNKLEFDLVKTHSQAGCDILKEVDFPWPIAEMVLQHHERMNGAGYPNGVMGAEIDDHSGTLFDPEVVSACKNLFKRGFVLAQVE